MKPKEARAQGGHLKTRPQAQWMMHQPLLKKQHLNQPKKNTFLKMAGLPTRIVSTQ